MEKENIGVKIISTLIAIVIFIGIAYGVWQLNRKINFSFSYKDQVEEIVREEVKPQIDALSVKIDKLEKEVDELRKEKR